MLFLIASPAHAKYGGGTGEPNDPYLIFDANQMNAIGADSNDWDKHFLLCADIDLSGFTGTSFNIIGTDWRNPFTGVFDGNGHTISNFTYTSTGTDYIGLFGYVDDPNSEIKDLGLINPNVDAGTGRFVGSLVGSLESGTISGCCVDGGSVSGENNVGGLLGINSWDATITNCYSSAAVSGSEAIGGLVGRNYQNCTITNCYSTGSVSGNESVGGLVGYNSDGTISNCYSTGSVAGNRSVGGLVGENGGWIGATITNCYSTGSVSGDDNVGGLLGVNDYGEVYGEVIASFWDIETSGQSSSDGGTGKTTAQMQMMSTFTDAGWDFENIWWILEGAGYPRLCWEEKYGGGTGHPNDPYLIYTAEQMNTIGACQCDWDKCFLLCADINLSAFTGTGFNIIGERYYDSGWVENPFTGVFDGNGHTITNFTYTSTGKWYIGLFGYVDDYNAEIRNLGLIDPNVDAGSAWDVGSLVGWLRDGTISNCYIEGGSVSGDRYVGGLVGYNSSGTISNCYSTGSVSGNRGVGGLIGYKDYGTISNCYATGDVEGNKLVGGLVGFNREGTIANCYSSCLVWGVSEVGGLVGENYKGIISNCYSTGDVSGYGCVGGLVGWSSGTIANCYSSGDVSGNYCVGGLVGNSSYGITNCYSTGDVTGYGLVGGLVGENEYGTITNCYSTGSVSGAGSVGGLVGKNWGGTITNCHSTSSVTGSGHVGGLVGGNSGLISNCYSEGSVSGNHIVGGLVGSSSGTIANCYSSCLVWGVSEVGGLVGWNSYGTITNSYATGSIVGETYYIGGLVGYNKGDITNSFWDIETSGQAASSGGTGKTTTEMQTMSTFTDAGWDFVGETVNGIDDIWFIPQQDYPHLWWEGMQVLMKLTPRTLNCRSKGNWVKAHLTLPEGFTVADVDSNRPAVLHSFGFESAPLHVSVNENELVQIEAAFEREQVCSLTGDWPEALTVAGFLTDGNIFLGTSTVRMIAPGLKDIGELALYWLNADCVQPDWCDGIDMNRDSIVNLLDYALLQNSQVEFVSE